MQGHVAAAIINKSVELRNQFPLSETCTVSERERGNFQLSCLPALGQSLKAIITAFGSTATLLRGLSFLDPSLPSRSFGAPKQPAAASRIPGVTFVSANVLSFPRIRVGGYGPPALHFPTIFNCSRCPHSRASIYFVAKGRNIEFPHFILHAL